MKKILATIFLITLWVAKTHASLPPGDTAVYILSTDKAMYNPGEKVTFKLSIFPSAAFVRYRHLDEIIKEEPLKSGSWQWQPPAADYRGYLVEVYTKSGKEQTIAAVAVDVSSNWAKFPRYGFLSQYEKKTNTEMDSVIGFLNRNHINGLQFYDWQDKHHQPLAGTVMHPAERWMDIADRECALSTVQAYIKKAHEKNMNAMFYNLCYGALSDGIKDGVQPQWFMYNDAAHQQYNAFNLPKPPFKSDIIFIDPSNTGWQQYLAAKNDDVYKVFDFDGYHVDQVGERGKVYNYNGDTIDLGATFHPFLQAMKTAHPDKKIVMNAVNQFGQQNSIATAPVDFIYAELWTGNEGYKELAEAIQNNYTWSNGKSTVLAAYLNYKNAEKPGTFNMPGVLLADAVIFSFGGSHIELGEHMLGKEYFPNNNLTMTADLKRSVISYYDFLTAYENLLRDDGHFNTVPVNCINGKMTANTWPPQMGKVSVQGKKKGAKQVLHFINFANAASLNWRDADGTQPTPAVIRNADMEITMSSPVTKIWFASPDIHSGIPQSLPFTQNGNELRFTLPELRYWDMVVIE